MKNIYLYIAAASVLVSAPLIVEGCSSSTTAANNGATDAGMTATDGSSTGMMTNDDGAVSTGSDAASLVTAAQACADQSKARCLRNDACGNSVTNILRYGDEPTCESRLTSECVANLSASGTGSTPASVEACATAIPGETCADFLGDNPPAACIPQVGTMATGGACVLSAQCQSTYCAVPEHGACGVCAVAPAAGANCTVSNECGARGGLSCIDGVCATFVASGAACSSSVACASGFSCTGDADAGEACLASGTTVGAVCDAKKKTAPDCDPAYGLVCLSGACAAESFVAANAACGTLDGGVARCEANGTCVDPVTFVDGGSDAGVKSTMGTCLGAAANNGSCDIAAGPTCISPARCVVADDAGTAGTCLLPTDSTCP